MSRQRSRHPAADTPARTVDSGTGVSVVHRHRRRVTSEETDNRTRQNAVPEVYDRVGVRGSTTINMGDYNSVQVSVWVEIACASGPEHRAAAYQEASEEVYNWMQEEIDAATLPPEPEPEPQPRQRQRR